MSDHARPYHGRHRPPPRPPSPPPRTPEERILMLLDAAKMARSNAHRARTVLHDEKEASAAFYRAYEYLEMVRELKESLL